MSPCKRAHCLFLGNRGACSEHICSSHGRFTAGFSRSSRQATHLHEGALFIPLNIHNKGRIEAKVAQGQPHRPTSLLLAPCHKPHSAPCSQSLSTLRQIKVGADAHADQYHVQGSWVIAVGSQVTPVGIGLSKPRSSRGNAGKALCVQIVLTRANCMAEKGLHLTSLTLSVRALTLEPSALSNAAAACMRAWSP